MKIKFLAMAMVAGSTMFISSCDVNLLDTISGDGNVMTESREVSEFKSVEASHGLHVFITFGSPVSVEVEADANLHDVIHTESYAGNLKIYCDKNIRHAKAKNIRITVPELVEIEASSAADVRCDNTLQTKSLQLSSSSAADIRIDVEADEVQLEASSSGSISAKGKAGDIDIDVSSAGSVDTDHLEARNCKVSVSSAGNASVWVTGNLDADASSAGSIRYRGEPESKKVIKSSAGSVSQR